MKLARVQVSWEPSVSNDVLTYDVLVINEDTQKVLKDSTVSSAETNITVEVGEDTNITATVVADDGSYTSVPVSASFYIGDLTPPISVGSVGFEILEILDVEQNEDEDNTVEGVEPADDTV